MLASTKQKAFADDNLNVASMQKFVFGRMENIVGKGENAGLKHFPLVQDNFQKLLLQSL